MFETKNAKGELNNSSYRLVAVMSLIFGLSIMAPSVNAGGIAILDGFTKTVGSLNTVDGVNGESLDDISVELHDDKAITLNFVNEEEQTSIEFAFGVNTFSHLNESHPTHITKLEFLISQEGMTSSASDFIFDLGQTILSFDSPSNFGWSQSILAGDENIKVTLDFLASGYRWPQNMGLGFELAGFDADNDFSIAIDIEATPQAPASVPLPAAAWLFISGLMGLGAVSRRKR